MCVCVCVCVCASTKLSQHHVYRCTPIVMHIRCVTTTQQLSLTGTNGGIQTYQEMSSSKYYINRGNVYQPSPHCNSTVKVHKHSAVCWYSCTNVYQPSPHCNSTVKVHKHSAVCWYSCTNVHATTSEGNFLSISFAEVV